MMTMVIGITKKMMLEIVAHLYESNCNGGDENNDNAYAIIGN